MKGSFYRPFLFLAAAAILFSFSLHAQNPASTSTKPKKKQDSFWNRVNVGGNLGFQIGTVTGIVITPEVAVRVFDQLYVGTGFIYQYYSFKDYYLNTKTGEFIDFSSNVFGGRIYLRYYLASIFDNWIGNFFAHTEYEYLYYTRPYHFDPLGIYIDPYYNTLSPGKEVVEVNSFFVGGGYRQPVGGKVFLDLLILFNLNDSYNSPYSNPIFRLGVGVGL
jgi:hypothetical protein